MVRGLVCLNDPESYVSSSLWLLVGTPSWFGYWADTRLIWATGEVTCLDRAVAKSLANGLVGTGFASWHWI